MAKSIVTFGEPIWVIDFPRGIFYIRALENRYSNEKYIIFENLEALRGLNVLNFDEQYLLRQLNFMNSQTNMMLQKTNLKKLKSCSREKLTKNVSVCQKKFCK